MGPLKAHEQMVSMYNKQPLKQALLIETNLSERKTSRFQQDQRGRSFLRKEIYGRASEWQIRSKGRGRSKDRGRLDFQ